MKCYHPRQEGYGNLGYCVVPKSGLISGLQYTESNNSASKKSNRHYAPEKNAVLKIVGFVELPIILVEQKSEEEERFDSLVAKWKEETGGYSTTLHKTANNNYLEIIGMGKNVVPFILKELQKEAAHWFVALKAITGANPVPKNHVGKIEEMRKDWLQWGRDNNLIG